MKCYICKVSDPNKTHYDPDRHGICLICSVKLWELANIGVEFDCRKKTIIISTKKPNKKVTHDRKVILSTGYEVDLADDSGFEHLFNAIIGDITIRVKDTEEFSEGGFALVHEICERELHFIAGQLYHMGSSLDIMKLLDEFNVQWDRIAEKLNREDFDRD